jgi:hypothetical protein
MPETIINQCPECGKSWQDGLTCQDYFYQMLYWEAENPALGEVHHLMVLCYHLQHPSLYSPEGLQGAQQLLADFVAKGITPQEVRQEKRSQVDSGRRKWKIKGTPGCRGSYEHPMAWEMTAADVVAGGAESYCANVRKWAQLTNATLKTTLRIGHP